MKHQVKAWLVAYDIRDPRRLRRVYRAVRADGVQAQYSAYTVEADDVQIQRLLDRVKALINVHLDDVRAYHLPETCTVWSLGRQDWPEGLQLSGTHAARLVMATACDTVQGETDAEHDAHQTSA